jgi:ribosomal protein S5
MVSSYISRTKGKFGGARIFIPASHGAGVIVGGAVRSV